MPFTFNKDLLFIQVTQSRVVDDGVAFLDIVFEIVSEVYSS